MVWKINTKIIYILLFSSLFSIFLFNNSTPLKNENLESTPILEDHFETWNKSRWFRWSKNSFDPIISTVDGERVLNFTTTGTLNSSSYVHTDYLSPLTQPILIEFSVKIQGYTFQNVYPKKPLFAAWLYEGKSKNEVDFELGWYENMDVSVVSYGDMLGDGSPNKISSIRVRPPVMLNDGGWHNVTMVWKDDRIQVSADGYILGETIAPEKPMHFNIGVYSHDSNLIWSTFIGYVRISTIKES